MSETEHVDRQGGLTHEEGRKLREMMQKSEDMSRSGEDFQSKETDQQVLDLFNRYGLEAKPERPLKSGWTTTQDTVSTDPRYVELIKNGRLESQLNREATTPFCWKGRPKRLFAQLQCVDTQRAEGVAIHENELQRYQCSMLDPDLVLEHGLETIDLTTHLYISMKPFSTTHTFQQKVEEVRTCGDWIFVRDISQTHAFRRDSKVSLSLCKTWSTAHVKHLVVPSISDGHFPKIASLGRSTVTLLDETVRSVSMEMQAFCGTWMQPSAMLLGSKGISILDWKCKRTTLAVSNENDLITDVSQSPRMSSLFAVTSSRPRHALKLYDIRQMKIPLENWQLPEQENYMNARDRDERYFEVLWPSGKEQWLLASCLGGADAVGRSKTPDSDSATSSFHHVTASSYKTSDPCVGSMSVELTDRWQSCLAFLRYFGRTGPAAIFLEQHEKTANAKRDFIAKMKFVGSFIQTIATSLLESNLLTGNLTLKQKRRLGKKVFQIVEGFQVLEFFHAIWKLMKDELKDNFRSETVPQLCVTVLNADSTIHIAVSDSEHVIELPTDFYKDLKSGSLEWLESYIGSTWHTGARHLILPMQQWAETAGFINFAPAQLQELATIALHRITPGPEPPLARVLFGDSMADESVAGGLQWLNMEPMAVFEILTALGLVQKSHQKSQGKNLDVLERAARFMKEQHLAKNPIQQENAASSRLEMSRKEGISKADEDLLRRCLRSGEMLQVAFWSPAKRLKTLAAVLDVELPDGWEFLSSAGSVETKTLRTLLDIARKRDSGCLPKTAALAGLRILMKGLLHCGLVTCNAEVSQEHPDIADEFYSRYYSFRKERIRTEHPIQRQTERLQSRLGSPSASSREEQIHSKMHQLLTMLQASTCLKWQTSLTATWPDSDLPSSSSVAQQVDGHQAMNLDLDAKELWPMMLQRLNREDVSKLYKWLSRDLRLMQLFEDSNRLSLLHTLNRGVMPKIFTQVARLVHDRIDESEAQTRMELLPFEGHGKAKSNAKKQRLMDSWDAFASHCDSQHVQKKARL